MKHYRFHRNSSQTEILFHRRTTSLSHTVSERHFLTIVCGLLDTKLERNRVVAQFYYSDTQEKVYVLLQIRFVPNQCFLAFVSSDDMLPLICLPNPMPLTDEDMFIIRGLQLVTKSVLAKLDYPNLLTCARSVLEDSKCVGKSLEVPPLQPSLNMLPCGFQISDDDQPIICPHPYHILLHKTNTTHTTYLLVNSAANIKEADQFLVIFYKRSVDCVIKTVYTVDDSLGAIAVKKLDSFDSSLLSSYDTLLLECCKEIVCAELKSMLHDRGYDHLRAFLTE